MDDEYRAYQLEFQKKWREKNKSAISEKNRDKYRAMKLSLFERYGGKCVCCSEDRMEFLAIDHVNGGGNKQRKTIGSHDLFRILLKSETVLPEYQILCHNCNMAIGFYGYCPHKR